jgi:solute carrier family 25 citrate transporter 1
MSAPPKKAKTATTPLGTHLLAGGTAGLMEALVCHPLDTIKVRMQLSKSGRGQKGVGRAILLQCIAHRLMRTPQVKARGFLATGAMIVKKESPLGLYKGSSSSSRFSARPAARIAPKPHPLASSAIE